MLCLQDIFRKYPNRYESIISALCENLDTLDEPEAKVKAVSNNAFDSAFHVVAPQMRRSYVIQVARELRAWLAHYPSYVSRRQYSMMSSGVSYNL